MNIGDTKFPIPDNKIALFDLDGTILDDNYQITDLGLTKSIMSAQSAGWLLGLSSDSAYETMAEWRNRFGMNGPIIAEKGAVVEDLEGNLLYDREVEPHYQISRAAIAQYFTDLGYVTWEGDPVKVVRDREPIGQPGEPIILMSNQRRCSLVTFIRRKGENGKFEIDKELFDEHLPEVQARLPKIEKISEDINHKLGLIIATGENVHKRTGTERLRRMNNLGRVAMIGNSISDYIGDDVAFHYAVQNSDEIFKSKANYITHRPFTEGVTELLQRFAKC